MGSMGSVNPPDSYAHAFFGSAATLCLVIAGSCVLVLPYAFSQTGVLLGVLTCVLVAWCNTLTCKLLLRSADKTGHDSYEGIAEAVGGRFWKVFTQVVLAVLLFGSIVANFAALADCGRRALAQLAKHSFLHNLLAAWEGRGIMAALALFPILPLCWLKGIRSLELVAAGGNVFLLSLVALVMHDSIKAGLPAVHSGALPILPTAEDLRGLPHAFSIFGFAFYVQPMLLPLLHEMPGGVHGVGPLLWAVRVVIMGAALVTYVLLGFFGAARYGQATQPNFLLNKWGGGGALEGAVNAVMVLYMSITVPPMLMSLRYTVDIIVAGEDAPYCAYRHHRETVALLGASLAVALLFPTSAEEVFSITGAIPVCLVCFVMPVAFHFATYTPRASLLQWGHRQTPEQAPLLLHSDDTCEYILVGYGPQSGAGSSSGGSVLSSVHQTELRPGRGVLQSLERRWKILGAGEQGQQPGGDNREAGVFTARADDPTCLNGSGGGVPFADRHAERGCGESASRPCQDGSGVWAAVCEGMSEIVLPAAVALLGLLLGAFSVYDQVIGLD